MPAPTFTSPTPRSTAAILALYVKIGACLLAVGADVRRIIVAGQLGDGRVTVDALLGADQLVTFTTVVEVVALAVAAVLFLRWQVTAHRNLAALGDAQPAVGVGAGVAVWFVPGVDLVLPFRVLADLWRAGEAAAAPPRVLRIWWAGWIVAVLAVVAARVLLGDAADVAERQRIDALRAAATGLSGLAAGLTIAVVATVTARQERRAAAVGAPRSAAPQTQGAGTYDGDLQVVSEEQARHGT